MPQKPHGKLAQHIMQEGMLHPKDFPVPVRSAIRAEHAALESLRQCHCDLDRYIYLRNLREKNEQLFLAPH